MKKKAILGVLIGAVVLGSSLFCMRCYAGMKSITINGVDFDSDITEDDLIEYIKENNSVFNDEKLDDYVIYIIPEYNLDNRTFLDKVSESLFNTGYTIEYTYSFDKDGLKSYLEEYNKTAEKSVSAEIVKTDDDYKIIEEIYGTTVDIDGFLDALDLNEVSVENYYVKPEITCEDLQNKLDELNSYVSWYCSYSNGDSIVSSVDYVDYIDEEISLNTDWISEAISEKLKSYNTVGAEREFITTSGEVVTLSSGTWGTVVDYDSEIEFLIDSFENCMIYDNREPEYAYSREEIGNTYVEVSLSDQYVWVYEDGVLSMESDCVTGDSHLNRNTPIGIYYISECINGKYLRGADYTTWVNKWMRLTNSGVGLHDAYWRSSFGGNIYTYNGSHGCVNLPKSFAYDLFDIAYVGMPVIIY